LCLFPLAGLSNKKENSKTAENYDARLDSVQMFDTLRNRLIPVALYLPSASMKVEQKVVILSHGYNVNSTWLE
jgi:hypothetical protein